MAPQPRQSRSSDDPSAPDTPGAVRPLTPLLRRPSTDLDVTCAYGQWGEVQVEFVQVHNEGPSAYRDTYADGVPGMQHVAVFCDNLAEAIKEFEAAGFPIVLYATRVKGKEYAMDTREKLGFMVELYEERVVRGFYKMIHDDAVEF